MTFQSFYLSIHQHGDIRSPKEHSPRIKCMASAGPLSRIGVNSLKYTVVCVLYFPLHPQDPAKLPDTVLSSEIMVTWRAGLN